MDDHQPSPRSTTMILWPYQTLLVAMIEQQLWLAAVEGKNKSRVFGLSSEAYASNRIFTISTATAKLGHGGSHGSGGDDDGRHDDHNEVHAGQLLDWGPSQHLSCPEQGRYGHR
ncbi:UNVERIFIED_CONTAM: hypothetical protein Sindi_2692300 [Sesamum indicum]